MGEVYHGSSQSGISKLEPKKSTHGTFVYATPYKELAVIFSGRCGDDLTYTLYRESKNEPWKLVERIPNGFDTMFSNSSSIYTLDDLTFKDIQTGFAEVVSEIGVVPKKEENIENVYNVIKTLASQKKIELYTFPNRPNKIPNDDSDLIQKEINQCHRENRQVSKNTFKRLLYLHPNLLSKVNNILRELDLGVYSKDDLVDIFEEFVVRQMLDVSHEQYLISSIISISNIYPELLPLFQKKLLVLDKSHDEKINYIIDFLSTKFPDIPRQYVEQVKKYYLNDDRPFIEIGKEIRSQINKLEAMETLVSRSIDPNVAQNSILIIGPMGTGKTTIARMISANLNMPQISLDNREQLKQFYSNKKSFNNFKDFEFYLTGSVLTSLSEPCVIDFGAGHSVYENPILFYEMSKLISKFANVVYMMPSENKEESMEILNNRVLQRNKNLTSQTLNDNRHFISMPCNEQLATIIQYTKDKTPEQISKEILDKVTMNNIQELSHSPKI